ncbi:MAG: DUF4055 domain-containing protein [Acidobacteria bacterium]|nr:DUF4055 domain-containing protein [Acidobacteriota bacterium]
MPLDSKHPMYNKWKPAWVKLRDSYEGEDTIKDKGQAYLLPTPGQLLDGLKPNEIGYNAYMNYLHRARFPAYMKEAVKQMVGVMHNKPPVIELPPVMEPLLERATIDGESLPLMIRRINAEQLTVGRIGLLADAPKTGNPSLPYIALYNAETIINWDDGQRSMPVPQMLNLVILDETAPRRITDFQWEELIAYRILTLGNPDLNEPAGQYQQALFEDTTQFNASLLMPPTIRGRNLMRIPFVFVNACDPLTEPSDPPLLQLANECLGIYRGDADYRLNLYLQAQDTLVTIGDDKSEEAGQDKPLRVGAGSRINMPMGGDAKYIGVSDAGLSEQRQALENDHKRAQEIGGQLIDTTSRERESGEALKVRVAASTATLKEIAMTGAEGAQSILRIIAEWIGAEPAKVRVQANLDFTEAGMTPAEFVDLMAAKEKGLPISDESAHAQVRKRGLSELEFAAEMALIIKERKAKVDMARAMMPPQPNQPPQPQQQGG